ncbi:MAG: hypothetical protein OEV49_04130 [candidate division Zixibacteria bacterium]|nr:hypothetical protein [candidate division Zixibacteria bacterium]MDH3936204.1 hypothetical protein [candidate division Zixibacteria bacterium]MDH4033073.1 hypothetical protein [candidate division Zixibacteria bacterium]
MKRFLLVGALFGTAALLGFGIVLFLPTDASATWCDTNDRFTWFDCDDPVCSEPTQVGVYDCGSDWFPWGRLPCDCVFIRCQLKCPTPLP